MPQKQINENFFHNCGEAKVALNNCKKAISEMGYSAQQVIDILDFYLFHAPVLRSDKTDDGFGLRRLSDFGWKGQPDMSRLEGRLLKSSNIGTFCFIKSDAISQTLKAMDLEGIICSTHPRAVIKQNIVVKVLEDGSTQITPKETRMECLFRHIRNSFAHNHTYCFESGNIMLEDCDDNKKVSARILLPRFALIEWMDIISNKESG